MKEISKLEKELNDKDKNVLENDTIEKEEFLKRNVFRKVPPFRFRQSEKAKTKEAEYNCNECDFQGAGQLELNKHINLKHMKSNRNDQNSIECRNCGENFSSKWNLMNHRKSMHLNSVAYCRNKLEGKCNFSDEICWWNHSEKQINNEQNVKCFVCSKLFDSKVELMMHRKNDHPELIRPCNMFRLNCCIFQAESCWYKHVKESKGKSDDNSEDKNENKTTSKDDKEEEETVSPSVFQKVSENQDPPLKV